MVFVEISAKNDKSGYLNPILGNLGVTHDLSWWLALKRMVDVLFVLTELSSLSVNGSGAEAKWVQLGCFLQGVDLFALKFYLHRVVPINHSWHQETRDTGLGLPDAEDRIPLRSLVLTQYRSVTDGRADKRICMHSACGAL